MNNIELWQSVLAQMQLALVQVVMLCPMAWMIGARYHGSIWLGAFILILSVFSYVGMGFFLGVWFAKRSEEVVVALSAIGVPLLVLGGTFFPLEIMPRAMQLVAQFDPILHMNQAFKGVAAYGLGVSELHFELIFLVLFCAVSMVLGVVSYRQMLTLEHQE